MISLIQQPNKYTPVNNPVIFQVQSDDSRIQFFTVQVSDNLSNIIANLKIFTTPGYRSGAYTDLSGILSNTVDYQLLPSSNVVDAPAGVLQAYKLVITEKLYDTTTNLVIDGAATSTGVYYVWNGLIDRVTFSNYQYKSYVMTLTGSTTNFLTNKPLVSSLYRTSTEYLYFLNDGISGYADLKLYGQNNLLLGNHNISLSGYTSGCTRLDISPAAINSLFGVNLGDNNFGDMFDTPFGTNYSINSANYFTVTLTDLSGNTKSVTRTYVLKNIGCANIPVQLVFANQAGGIDAINFFNPKETIDVTKTSINKNPYTLNNGLYTDNYNTIFNEDTSVININSKSTYQVISDALKDAEALWLKELIKSSKVWLRLSNSLFYPISVTTLNYPVQQKRYSTSLIRLSLSFTINDTGISF